MKHAVRLLGQKTQRVGVRFLDDEFERRLNHLRRRREDQFFEDSLERLVPGDVRQREQRQQRLGPVPHLARQHPRLGNQIRRQRPLGFAIQADPTGNQQQHRLALPTHQAAFDRGQQRLHHLAARLQRHHRHALELIHQRQHPGQHPRFDASPARHHREHQRRHARLVGGSHQRLDQSLQIFIGGRELGGESAHLALRQPGRVQTFDQIVFHANRLIQNHCRRQHRNWSSTTDERVKFRRTLTGSRNRSERNAGHRPGPLRFRREKTKRPENFLQNTIRVASAVIRHEKRLQTGG